MNVKSGAFVRGTQLVILLGLIMFLEFVARTGIVDAITIAPPTVMVSVLFELLLSGELLGDIWQTGYAVFVAFFMGSAVGIPIGWMLWRWGLLMDILDPYLIVFYAAPTFAFYPVFIALFGLGRIPIILIAFAMSSIVIIVNTANGLGMVSEVYRKVGRSLRLSRYERFRYVLLPASAPYLFVGLKLGFIYAMVGVIASEFILANAGLGHLIKLNYEHFDTEEMYAVMLLVVGLAILTNYTLGQVEERIHQRSVAE